MFVFIGDQKISCVMLWFIWVNSFGIKIFFDDYDYFSATNAEVALVVGLIAISFVGILLFIG